MMPFFSATVSPKHVGMHLLGCTVLINPRKRGVDLTAVPRLLKCMYYLTGADTSNKPITRLRRKHHTALRKMAKA
jgi:hypothetical protein